MTNLWVLNGEPQPAQSAAIDRSHGMDGWGHFLDMGLGKTSLTLNEHLVHRRDFGTRGCVVVAPNSFKNGWAREAENFAYGRPLFVYDSGNQRGLDRFIRTEPEGTIIVNFESYRTEAVHSRIGPFLEGAMMVVDESIRLKDHKSETTKSILAHRNLPQLTRILSGKPLTQGPHDLWAQLRFIGGIGDKYNYYQFRNQYCIMGGFTGWQVVGTKNDAELNALLKTCSFTARKGDYLDIIEKSYPDPRRLEMTKDQRVHYKRMLEELWAEIGADETLSVQQIITRNLKLQQITSGFIIAEDGSVTRIMPLSHNPKMVALKHFISEELSGKIVVSAIHVETIRMLGEALAEYNPVYIRGGMSGDEIEEAKRTFNSDNSNRVVIVQQRAAKYGHTLLGTKEQPCYTMFFFENSYSLDDRSQIEDRIHRIGQNFGAVYIDAILSPMDAAAIRALQRKEDVASSIMGYARESGLFGRRTQVNVV